MQKMTSNQLTGIYKLISVYNINTIKQCKHRLAK